MFPISLTLSVMVKILWLVLGITQAFIFDFKIITNVRQALEKNLNYIGKNYNRVSVDCLFGVALSTALLRDVYHNGSHPMDESTLRLILKSIKVLEMGRDGIDEEYQWVAENILDYQIWLKHLQYKYNKLDSDAYIPDYQVIQKIYEYQSLNNDSPDSDYCLQDIINLTTDLVPRTCQLSSDCWEKYYGYDVYASGYTLTHKLLLLQVVKARKCLVNEVEYEAQTEQICSMVFAEVYNMDFLNVIGDMFDLFLEEIVLCGYEGYTEFFNYDWLHYILKAQKKNGCYPATLSDNLKTRLKRNYNIFEDGCADHTTGVGTAVLALHYNYILKQNIDDFGLNWKTIVYEE